MVPPESSLDVLDSSGPPVGGAGGAPSSQVSTIVSFFCLKNGLSADCPVRLCLKLNTVRYGGVGDVFCNVLTAAVLLLPLCC